MKLIWKMKRFLLRTEDRLKCKQYCKGVISYEEYCNWISISNDRWWELIDQAKQKGWEL